MSARTLNLLEGRINLRFSVSALRASYMLVAGISAVLMVSLMTGNYALSMPEVWATLWGTAPSQTATTVVWEFRFPRTLVAFMVGAFLGLSGATLQYVTRNPLADPSLVGVSQGAALVVVALTILAPDLSTLWRPIMAFAGAITVAILIVVGSAGRAGETLRFILMGIGIAALLTSITTALLSYGNTDRAMSALGWLSGSVHSSGWQEVKWLTVVAVIAIPLLLVSARPLSAIRFGEDIAIGLGVRIRATRWALIALSVGLAATAVAAVGPLGFVGLVAPHLARKIAHSGVGMHLVLTGLTGALMVGLADLVGRTVFDPVQIPAGLVTAMIGVPVFVTLIVRSQARNQL